MPPRDSKISYHINFTHHTMLKNINRQFIQINAVYRDLLKKWLHDSEFEEAKACMENEAYEILANDVLLDGYYTEQTKHLYKKFNIKIE